MINRQLKCPDCGSSVTEYTNPAPVVDIIIEMPLPDGSPGIVLIERKHEPYGWAIPGGYVDYGETVETAAIREAKEETNLDITGLRQMHVFSDPMRDPRSHTISTTFMARASGEPQGGDDAKTAKIFPVADLPQNLVFDHNTILDHYLQVRK